MKMRNQKNKLLSLCVVILLSTGLGIPSSTPVQALTDATVQSYEQQLAEIAVKQQEALNRLQSVRNDLYSASQQKAEYDELINLSTRKKNLEEEKLASLETQIAATEAEIAEKEAAIRAQHDAFLSRMVTLYEEGKASYLGLLLGADDIVDFLSRMDKVTTIQDYDRNVIEKLRTDKAALHDAELALQENVLLQEAAIDSLNDSIAQAEEYSEKAVALMTELQTNEAAAMQQYNAYLEEDRKLNEHLQTYLAELQEKQRTDYVGGELGFPLPLDTYFYVSSEYGYRTLWGATNFHYGLDMACACNTPIYAANAGTVIKSEYHYSYGNYVVVDHGGGMATLYAHMNERKVSVGDFVAQGQLIGLVGTTGDSTGYHLHFEVRINGQHTQPRDYIVLPDGK